MSQRWHLKSCNGWEGAGETAIFTLKSNVSLVKAGKVGGCRGEVWKSEPGNVNHVDSSCINCAWSSVSGQNMFCSHTDCVFWDS